MRSTTTAIAAAVTLGLVVLAPQTAGATETCNKDAHAAGPYIVGEGLTGGLYGQASKDFATTLGGIGQFTGPGNSGASAACRDARRG